MIKIKGFGIIEEIFDDNTNFFVRSKYIKCTKGERKRLFTPIGVKKIKDVTKNDYLGLPINKKNTPLIWDGSLVYTPHTKNRVIKNELPLKNLDFWWFVGRVIADGWIISYKRKDRKNGYTHRIVLCCGKHEIDTLKTKMKLLPYVATLSEERTTFRFTINNQELYEFLSMFGKYCHGKFIPQNIIDMPIEYLKPMIEGYLSGDGYVEKLNVKTVTTISKKLAYTMRECIMKVYNVPVRLYYNANNKMGVIEGRKFKMSPTYVLGFKEDVRKQDKAFSDGEYVWLPLRKIETVN